jgi:hypothetical protein
MKTKQYLTIVTLRSLGLTQNTEALNRLLNTSNQKIADRIQAEIHIEIEHNYDENLLKEYLNLIKENGFSSETTQSWLKTHIAAFDEITTDHINIMLAELLKT